MNDKLVSTTTTKCWKHWNSTAEMNSSTYLVTGFNKAKGCFSAQMSCFDDVGFPACDGFLLNGINEEKAAKRIDQNPPKLHLNNSLHLTGSHHKAVSNISNEAVNMNPQISTRSQKRHLKVRVERIFTGCVQWSSGLTATKLQQKWQTLKLEEKHVNKTVTHSCS